MVSEPAIATHHLLHPHPGERRHDGDEIQ